MREISISDILRKLGEEKYIKITRPRMGDVWRIGEHHNIEWEMSRRLARSVHIGLFNRRRRFKRIIAPRAQNSGSFDWNISTRIRTGEYMIGIATVDLETYGFSQVFRIVAFPQVQATGAGEQASFAIRERDKTVWAWGMNGGPQHLGDTCLHAGGSELPVQVIGLSDVIQVEADHSYALALGANGEVHTWGVNFVGNHGQGAACPHPLWSGITQAVKVPGLSQIIKIAAGSWALALKNNGTVWIWGNCTEAAYPGGTSPIQVQNLQNIIDIAAGGSHCLALDQNGDVWAWGFNDQGQLGDGTTNNSQLPKMVFSGVTAIAAGKAHSLTVKQDGTIWGWGQNFEGQLGIGSQTSMEINPVRANILIPPDVIKIAAKRYSSFAITSDNKLWAWGDSSYGQFGNGNMSSLNASPTVIHEQVKDVSPGWMHTLITKTDRRLWSSGWNYFGQLGDGSKTDRTTLVSVLLPM